MPKTKTHRGANPGQHSAAASPRKPIDMDKVKIKRVKRNKKKITTAEKIMAGVGVGSTLMGGAGAVKPQPQTTQFVRTTPASSGSASGKIKQALSKIFGTAGAEVGTAASQAGGLANKYLGVPQAKADASGIYYGIDGTTWFEVGNSGKWYEENDPEQYPVPASELPPPASGQEPAAGGPESPNTGEGGGTASSTAPGAGDSSSAQASVSFNAPSVTSKYGASEDLGKIGFTFSGASDPGDWQVDYSSLQNLFTSSNISDSVDMSVQNDAVYFSLNNVPPGTYPVTVSSPSLNISASFNLIVLSGNSSTPTPNDPQPPSISSVQGQDTSTNTYSNGTAVAGQYLDLYGTFAGNGGDTVSIDGQNANVSYDSASQINVQLPGNITAGQHSVTVSNSGGTSSPSAFTVTVPTQSPAASTTPTTINFSNSSINVPAGTTGVMGLYINGTVPTDLTASTGSNLQVQYSASNQSVTITVPANTPVGTYTVLVSSAQANFNSSFNVVVTGTQTQSSFFTDAASQLDTVNYALSAAQSNLANTSGAGLSYVSSLLQNTQSQLTTANNALAKIQNDLAATQTNDQVTISGYIIGYLEQAQSAVAGIQSVISQFQIIQTSLQTAAPVISGIQGFIPATSNYINGTAIAGQYLILYGSFSANNDNQANIDGQAANISGQTGSQIDIQLPINLSVGQHSITVSDSGGTSSPSSFTVTVIQAQTTYTLVPGSIGIYLGSDGNYYTQNANGTYSQTTAPTQTNYTLVPGTVGIYTDGNGNYFTQNTDGTYSPTSAPTQTNYSAVPGMVGVYTDGSGNYYTQNSNGTYSLISPSSLNPPSGVPAGSTYSNGSWISPTGAQYQYLSGQWISMSTNVTTQNYTLVPGMVGVYTDGNGNYYTQNSNGAYSQLSSLTPPSGVPAGSTYSNGSWISPNGSQYQLLGGSWVIVSTGSASSNITYTLVPSLVGIYLGSDGNYYTQNANGNYSLTTVPSSTTTPPTTVGGQPVTWTNATMVNGQTYLSTIIGGVTYYYNQTTGVLTTTLPEVSSDPLPDGSGGGINVDSATLAVINDAAKAGSYGAYAILSSADQQTVNNSFANNPTAVANAITANNGQIAQSSYIAWGLSLGNYTTPGQSYTFNGTTYYLSADATYWSTTVPQSQAASPTYAVGQVVDGSAIGQIAGINYVYNGNSWSIVDGQQANGSQIGLTPGQIYISQGGQWVDYSGGQNQNQIPASFSATSSYASDLGLGSTPGPALQNYEKQGSNGQWYVLSSDGSTWTQASAPADDSGGLTTGNINTVIYDGTSEMNAQISALNLTSYTIPTYVNPGTVLAYMLSLGSAPGTTNGQQNSGNSGYYWNAAKNAWAAQAPQQQTSLQITGGLTSGTAGSSYSASLGASGGSGTGYSFYISSGSLPPGLLMSASGAISGTIKAGSAPGVSDFTVTATDSQGNSVSQNFGIAVSSTAAVSSATLSSSISNGSSNNVGTAWTITFNNIPAGQPLSVSGGIVGGAQSQGTVITASNAPGGPGTYTSTTNANGSTNVTLTGVFQASDVGTWNETWMAGSSTIGSLNFTVAAAAKSIVFTGNGANGTQSLNLGSGQAYWAGAYQEFQSWVQSNQQVLSQDTITVNYSGQADANNNPIILNYTISGPGITTTTYTPQQLAAAINSYGQMLVSGVVNGNNLSESQNGSAAAIGTILNDFTPLQQAVYFLGTAALQLPGAPATNLAITTGDQEEVNTETLVFEPPTTATVNSPNSGSLAQSEGINDQWWVTPAQADTALALVQNFFPNAQLVDGSAIGGVGAGFGQTTLPANQAQEFLIVYTDPKTGQQMEMNASDVLAGATIANQQTGQLSISQTVLSQIATSTAGMPGGGYASTALASTAAGAIALVTVSSTGSGSGTGVGSGSATDPNLASAISIFNSSPWAIGTTIMGYTVVALPGGGSGLGNSSGVILATNSSTPLGVVAPISTAGSGVAASGTITLPSATAGTSYKATLPAGTWTLLGGSIPPGLGYNVSNNQLSGTPTVAGTYQFTLSPVGGSGSTQFTLVVAPAASTALSGSAATGSSATTGISSNTSQQSYAIQNISEDSGQVGDTVTIIGTGFSQASGYQVQFITFSASGSSSVIATANAFAAPALMGNNVSFQVPNLAPGQYGLKVINSAANSFSNSIAFGITGAANASNPVSPITNGGVNISAGASAGAASSAAATTAATTGGLLTVDQLSGSDGAPAPLVISTGAIPDAVAGSAYAFQLTASGGSGSYQWSVASGSLPQGLSLDPSSGIISGTAESTGLSSFSIQAVDMNTGQVQSQTLSLNVDPPVQSDTAVPLAISTASIPDAVLGNSYAFQLTASGDSGSYQWSVSQGSLPNGLTLDPSSGIISGVPAATGGSSFSIQVQDVNTGQTQVQNLSLNVDPQPSPGSTSNGSGVGIAYGSGGITTFGSVATQPITGGLQMPAFTQGLQMPAGYPSSGGGSGLQYQAPLPATAQASGAQTGSTTYTVKKGDTLSGIAKKVYGDSSKWRKILSANPNSLGVPGNTKTLRIGFKLTIPN